jgi:hypothetical protein
MDDYKKAVLNVYFQDRKDMGRFTSQDICDNVRDMVSLTPDEVTEYLMQRGYILQRQDDRLVWTKL